MEGKYERLWEFLDFCGTFESGTAQKKTLPTKGEVSVKRETDVEWRQLEQIWDRTLSCIYYIMKTYQVRGHSPQSCRTPGEFGSNFHSLFSMWLVAKDFYTKNLARQVAIDALQRKESGPDATVSDSDWHACRVEPRVATRWTPPGERKQGRPNETWAACPWAQHWQKIETQHWNTSN